MIAEIRESLRHTAGKILRSDDLIERGKGVGFDVLLWRQPARGFALRIDGRPVAWSPSSPLRGMGRPMRPVNVVRAVRPVRPVRPVEPAPPFSVPMPPGGWSALSFAEWLVVGDPKPEQVTDTAPAPTEAEDTNASPRRLNEV